ncbi:unnamed protein product [Ixodes hexagonus]
MNSESKMKELPPGDPKLTANIVSHLKSRGLFDQLRRDCLGDVDTKPAYLNLKQRIEGYITKFLAMQTWTPDMNKNHVRDIMRREINESGMLSAGMDHLVDQIVNPKIYHVFTPEVEDGVRQYLGLSQPKEPSSSAPPVTDAESASCAPPASLPPPACLPPPAPLPPPKSEFSIDETTQDVPGSCSPKLYTAVLTPEGFSDTSSEPQLMIVTESNERPEEADSSLPEATESPTVPQEASVELPGEESLQTQPTVIADPVPISADPEEIPNVPSQVTDEKVTRDDQESAGRKAEDKKGDGVKKESRVSDQKHEEKKGDVIKKESKPASNERKGKKVEPSRTKDTRSHSSRSDSHAKSSSKRSGSDPSRPTKTSKSKTEDGLPRDSRDSSREKGDQVKERHGPSRERGDSSREETSRDKVDLLKEAKGRSSSSSRASKTKDSRSDRRRPDDKHHSHGSSQHHDDRRHHSSRSSREDGKSKDRSDSHRSHGEGRRDKDRSSTKDSSRQHKSSRSSEKHSDCSRESRKDKTEEKDKRASVSRHQASEAKEGTSSKKTPEDVIRDTLQVFELAAQMVSEEASDGPSHQTSEDVSQEMPQDAMHGTLELVEAKEAEILRFSYVTDKHSGNCEIDLQLVSTVPMSEPEFSKRSELHAEDGTQLESCAPAIADTTPSELLFLDSSENVPMATTPTTKKKLRGEKRSSDKKRQRRMASDGHESDGAWSDVTVSSVHTSDLSSYDDRISVSSADEDDEATKEKKKISLREIKKITSSSNEDEDRMSKSETEQVPPEKISPDNTPARKLPDIQESCPTPLDYSIAELPSSSSSPGVTDAPISPAITSVVDVPIVGATSAVTAATSAHAATVTATPAGSTPEPKMGLRRQRKINPKYASEEFSSIFTEGKRPTGTIDFGARHSKLKQHEEVTGRVESRRGSHPPPCEEPHEEAVENAPSDDRDQSLDTSGPERLRRPSRRHSGSEARPRSESMSSKRYESSDLYKPRPVIKSGTRRSRPSPAATLEATEEEDDDEQLVASSDEEHTVRRKGNKGLKVCIGVKKATSPPAKRRRL